MLLGPKGLFVYAGLDYRIHFEAIRSDAVCISAYYKSSFVYVIHSGMEWNFCAIRRSSRLPAAVCLAKGNSQGAMLAWATLRIDFCQIGCMLACKSI